MRRLQSMAGCPRALVGCAGWGIHRDVAGEFPPDGSQLERYAAVLPAVEINSSFYRPHRPQTYARWAAGVPDGFRFSVKLPRTITHEARLADEGGNVEALLDRFASEAGQLGDKLGCVLVQLPPGAVFDAGVAGDFLPRLRARFPCMLAWEARHPTWFGDDATTVLANAGVTRVRADPPAGQPGPHVPTTDSAYLRLHGAPKIYYSRYSHEALRRIETDVAAVNAAGHDCWCIFDNTAAFAAVPNALTVLRGVPPGD